MTIKLTREEAIQDLEAIKSFERYARGRLALDIAIEALKREPSDNEPQGDLISRAEAIEAITETLDAIDHVPKWVFDKLTSAIEILPSADRPRGEWTPCEEKLPSEKKAVLICDSHGNRFVGKLVLTDHGYKWSVPLFKVSKVWVDIEDGDAWMPLPEPYKESDTK